MRTLISEQLQPLLARLTLWPGARVAECSAGAKRAARRRRRRQGRAGAGAAPCRRRRSPRRRSRSRSEAEGPGVAEAEASRRRRRRRATARPTTTMMRVYSRRAFVRAAADGDELGRGRVGAADGIAAASAAATQLKRASRSSEPLLTTAVRTGARRRRRRCTQRCRSQRDLGAPAGGTDATRRVHRAASRASPAPATGGDRPRVRGARRADRCGRPRVVAGARWRPSCGWARRPRARGSLSPSSRRRSSSTPPTLPQHHHAHPTRRASTATPRPPPRSSPPPQVTLSMCCCAAGGRVYDLLSAAVEAGIGEPVAASDATVLRLLVNARHAAAAVAERAPRAPRRPPRICGVRVDRCRLPSRRPPRAALRRSAAAPPRRVWRVGLARRPPPRRRQGTAAVRRERRAAERFEPGDGRPLRRGAVGPWRASSASRRGAPLSYGAGVRAARRADGVSARCSARRRRRSATRRSAHASSRCSAPAAGAGRRAAERRVSGRRRRRHVDGRRRPFGARRAWARLRAGCWRAPRRARARDAVAPVLGGAAALPACRRNGCRSTPSIGADRSGEPGAKAPEATARPRRRVARREERGVRRGIPTLKALVEAQGALPLGTKRYIRPASVRPRLCCTTPSGPRRRAARRGSRPSRRSRRTAACG